MAPNEADVGDGRAADSANGGTRKFKTQNLNSLFFSTAEKAPSKEEVRDSASPGPAQIPKRVGTLSTATGQYKLATTKFEDTEDSESVWAQAAKRDSDAPSRSLSPQPDAGAGKDAAPGADKKSSFEMSEEELAKKGISLTSRFAANSGFSWDDDDDDNWNPPPVPAPAAGTAVERSASPAHQNVPHGKSDAAAAQGEPPTPWGGAAKPGNTAKSLHESIQALKDAKRDGTTLPIKRLGTGGAIRPSTGGDALSRFRIKTNRMDDSHHDPLSRDLADAPRGRFDMPSFGGGRGSDFEFRRGGGGGRFDNDRFSHSRFEEDDFAGGRNMATSWRDNRPAPRGAAEPTELRPIPERFQRVKAAAPAIPVAPHSAGPEIGNVNGPAPLPEPTRSAEQTKPAVTLAPPPSAQQILDEQAEIMRQSRERVAERKRQEEQEDAEKKARLAAKIKELEDRQREKEEEEAAKRAQVAQARKIERQAQLARQEEERQAREQQRLIKEREKAALLAHPAFSDESWLSRKRATAATKQAARDSTRETGHEGNKPGKDISRAEASVSPRKAKDKDAKPFAKRLQSPKPSPFMYSKGHKTQFENARLHNVARAGAGQTVGDGKAPNKDADATPLLKVSLPEIGSDYDTVDTAAGTIGETIPRSRGFTTTYFAFENGRQFFREPMNATEPIRIHLPFSGTKPVVAKAVKKKPSIKKKFRPHKANHPRGSD